MREWALAAGLALAWALALTGCGAVSHARTSPDANATRERDRKAAEDFAVLEERLLERLAAADPRLAERTGITASEELLHRVGTEAVLREDASARLRGSSLDVFAFHARSVLLDEVAHELAQHAAPLPESAPAPDAEGSLRRPRLERELVARLVEEERARVADEGRLADASADLVRAMVATWAVSSPFEWSDRDDWVARRLGEIKASLSGLTSRAARGDIDSALYPLERLLLPMEFPKGVAALTELRLAIDGGDRVLPERWPAERLSRMLEQHLGAPGDLAGIQARLQAAEQKLALLATDALGALPPAEQDLVRSRGRDLIFDARPCATPTAGPPSPRMRSIRPAPERAPVCGVLRALLDAKPTAAALVALHDDVVFALWSLPGAPSPPMRPPPDLYARPSDDAWDSLVHLATERPLVPLAAGLAAELYTRLAPGGLDSWAALGDAPLDILERELRTRGPGLASPRP